MSSIEPNDGGRERDSTEKLTAALSVACGNRSVPLKLGKKSFQSGNVLCPTPGHTHAAASAWSVVELLPSCRALAASQARAHRHHSPYRPAPR